MESITIDDPKMIKLVMNTLMKNEKKIILDDEQIIEYFETNKELDPQKCILNYIHSLKNNTHQTTQTTDTGDPPHPAIVLNNPEIIDYFTTMEVEPETYLLEYIKSPKNNIPIDELNAHYKEYDQYTEDMEKIMESIKTFNTKVKKNAKYFLWKYIKDKNTNFKCDICQTFVSKNYKGLSIHKRSCVPCKEKPEKGKCKKSCKTLQNIKENTSDSEEEETQEEV